MYSRDSVITNNSLKIKQAPANIIIKLNINIPLNIFSGLDILNNNIKPVNTVNMMHIVEYTSKGN